MYFGKCTFIFKATGKRRKLPVSINIASVVVKVSATKQEKNNSLLVVPEELQGLSVF